MRYFSDSGKPGGPLKEPLITTQELIELSLQDFQDRVDISGYKVVPEINQKGREFSRIIGANGQQCGYIYKLPNGGLIFVFDPHNTDNKYF